MTENENQTNGSTGANEGIDFAPIVGLSELINLPEDVSSPAFASAVRMARGAFKQRQEYNAFICTQLALRGIVPNATTVLDIGGWGSKGDVAADIRAWFSEVGRRLADEQIAVPPALFRPARQLLEQAWALAAQTARERIEADRKQAAEEFGRMKQDQEQTKARLAQVEEELRETERERDEAQRLAQELRQQLEGVLRQFEAARAAANAELASLRQQAEREQQAHRAELQQARAEHAQALANLQERFEAQVAKIEQAFAQEKSLLVKRAQELEQALLESERAAKTASDQAAQQARNLLLAVDKARQDALAASQRAIDFQKQVSAAQAQLGQVNLRITLLERELEQARLRNAELERSLAELKSRAKGARSRAQTPQARHQDKPPQ